MDYTGKKVIVRSYGAGVFFGILKEKTTTNGVVEVVLTNSRRLWYWSGACSLSQLATEGVKTPQGCKFSVSVPEICIEQVIEIIPCSDEAIKNIESVSIWKS